MKKSLLLFLLLFFLSSCNQAPEQNVSETKESHDVVKVSDEDYKMMVPLSESSIRGIYTNNDSDTYIDYDNMEEELLEITKEYLDTSYLFYEPGQVLDVSDAKVLLGREEEENVWGLNPKKVTNIDDSAIYVNTIIEQDFYTLDSEENKSIDTIAFGFGIDTTYEQADESTTITDDKIKDFITPYIASRMYEYLEQQKGVSNVNIICAFYKESIDSTLPGTYYTYGMIPKGQNKLAEKNIKTRNTKYVTYPDYSLEGDKINNEILGFIDSISSYFESYTGVTGLGKYEDDVLVKLNINLIVDSYSKVEIEAFSKYVKDNLSFILKDIPILEINIILPSEEILGIIEYENGKLVVDYTKQ